ncbi:hypothetical protein CC85DRAFT_283250 [Cutaneotrichosporon oleaginosum]|uniref:Uncharacterized protein n=1 Tax=Cutaneotrichosporon oleaginosum TaxID=879819 RepID=A0A0J1BAL4_9TREE|nr:uncharacterized protein CC85DRAFT_283250 [Cutaneotrichosporon oleaginosum]KLT44939.1 hypothetical protein CC85DRAFT_283250 [Cutaneotrichosporon oleaginosum]TXT12065.1 hypothetical protein COLE_02475 [Cutaneotrichosporon oleaginosum]
MTEAPCLLLMCKTTCVEVEAPRSSRTASMFSTGHVPRLALVPQDSLRPVPHEQGHSTPALLKTRPRSYSGARCPGGIYKSCNLSRAFSGRLFLMWLKPASGKDTKPIQPSCLSSRTRPKSRAVLLPWSERRCASRISAGLRGSVDVAEVGQKDAGGESLISR